MEYRAGFARARLARRDGRAGLRRTFWLGRVFRAPGVEPAFQRGGPEAHVDQLLRRTGAGGFIRSGAVGDVFAVLRLAAGPNGKPVGQHPDAAGDLVRV